jgi:hypothetical protein
MLVPFREFPDDLRRDLAKILRKVRPRLDDSAIAGIIDQLREADDVVTVLRVSPDPARTAAALETLDRQAARFGKALMATTGLLDVAKAALGYVPDLEQQLLEGLDMLAELTAAARPRPRRPKGGRPHAGAALAPGVQAMAPRWFAANVAAILRKHGARPSQHLDGIWADLLRTLWPHVMKAELTGDIRRLLRAAATD